jgi:hypothetical protein
VIRGPIIAAVLLAAAVPALAQTTSLPASGSGGVGSAGLRNGFPAAAGAVVLPTLANPANPTAGAIATGTTTTSAIGGPGGGGGGVGSGRGATPGSSGTGTGSSSRRGSGNGGNFVLCEPAGASGEAAFLVGTDLACAPQ